MRPISLDSQNSAKVKERKKEIRKGTNKLSPGSRLEAATLRLEDIASSTIELPQAVPALQQTLASPQSAHSSTSNPAPPPPPKAPEEPLPESIEEFDAFINQSVQKFVKLSDGLNDLIAQQVRGASHTSDSSHCPTSLTPFLLVHRPQRFSKGSRSSAGSFSSRPRLRSPTSRVLTLPHTKIY